MTKIDTLFVTKMSLKTTPFEAGHTPTAHRREYGPLSLGSQREVSGAPNENIVQNHLNIALLNVF